MPLIVGLLLGALQVYGFWRAEFGLLSFAVMLLCLIGLLFLMVHVLAAAIVALMVGRWRRAISSLIGVAAAILVVGGGIAVPIEWRFSVAGRSYYDAERLRAGNPDRQSWLLDAQFLGPDQTDLVYDVSDSAAPPYGGRSGRVDRDGCSLYIDRLDGHYYRQSLIC
ncbi:hypothetical protein [Dongia sp.]|uniref:hypothetical protein n=1 Tax=Dongia sp. TaxID=1977262 RepID=UPI0037508BB1